MSELCRARDRRYQTLYRLIAMKTTAINDTVTRQEMQDELQRLRRAIALIMTVCSDHFSQDRMLEIYALIDPPAERKW